MSSLRDLYNLEETILDTDSEYISDTDSDYNELNKPILKKFKTNDKTEELSINIEKLNTENNNDFEEKTNKINKKVKQSISKLKHIPFRKLKPKNINPFPKIKEFDNIVASNIKKEEDNAKTKDINNKTIEALNNLKL
jgi:predicted transcriptional regulator